MTQATETEIDYPSYLDKAPTDLQARFAIFIQEKTGLDPNSFKTKPQAFEEGVRLGVALRMAFQASPENREATERRRQERNQAAEQDEAPAAEAPAPRGRRGAKAAPAPEPAAPAVPAKRAGRPARKAQATAGAPF